MNRPISVVVCTYTARRWQGLLTGIAALQAQTLEPHEILVVVDHEPSLLERVAGELPGTVALASAGPPGLAGSRNTGARSATGSIVAFIDDDAVPEPDWLERLAGPYDDPAVVAVGGGIDPDWAATRPAWFPPEFDWVVGCTYRGLPEARAAVRNVIGANMSFRREIFEHLEFFPGLGHANGRSLGGEETDFCIRLAKLLPGSQIVYEPSARVRHHVPADRARFSYFMERCYIEGVSKAVLARRVGSSTGLASERAYVRAIPVAALRSVSHAVRKRQPAAALGAVAVAMGVGAAASGYAVSRLRRLSTMSPRDTQERPARATPLRALWQMSTATLAALLVLSVSAGLMLVSAADALSRSGRPHGGLLFWLGLFAILVPVTARLTSASPSRNERVGLLVLLGLASYLVKVFRDPFRFLYADEFVHQYNAHSILSTHALFRANPILPATAAYPGLEAPTAALSALTGLSTFAAGLVVIAIARLILMVGLFLLYEAVTGSQRLAGLAAALYAASPHFLFFIADYSYESLALSMAILALAAALRAHPDPGRRNRAWLIVAFLLTAGVVVTHHVTSYALIVTLFAICLMPLPWLRQRTPRPWTVAVVAIAMTAGWLALMARTTVGYLAPVVLGAIRETIRTVQGEAAVRQLFGSSGHVAQGPGWERLVALASVAVVAVAVAFGARIVWRRYRDRPTPLLFVIAAVGYVVSLGLRLVPAAWEVAVRASEFLFIGASFTLALFTLSVLDRYKGLVARSGLVLAALLLVMGGVISTTPSSTRLAQPYRVAVKGATLEPQAAVAAQWFSQRFGSGNRVAAQAADGRFFLVDGRQHVFVGSNPPIATVLSTKALYPWQIGDLRRYGIRFVVTDARKSGADVSDGFYFFAGNESHSTLAVAGTKFGQAGAAPIYDSGDIVVYDLEGAGLKAG